MHSINSVCAREPRPIQHPLNILGNNLQQCGIISEQQNLAQIPNEMGQLIDQCVPNSGPHHHKEKAVSYHRFLSSPFPPHSPGNYAGRTTAGYEQMPDGSPSHLRDV